MYLSFFKLKKKPFQLNTNPEFLWLGEKHEEILSILKYGVLDNKGFLLLTGDVGTGKTSLVNALVASLGEDVIVARVPYPGIEKVDLMNFMSHSFKMGKEFEGKERFLVHFDHFLNNAHTHRKKVLLIIDEAQHMSQDLLEEVRQLSNIERHDMKLLNIFLVGQNEFNNQLQSEQNRPLLQRLALNYNLKQLDEQETAELIKHRLKVAGSRRVLFTEGALAKIYQITEGTPRKINILCDHCLLSAFIKGKKGIDSQLVQAAAEDLALPIKSSSSDTGNLSSDKELSDEEGLQTKESAEDLTVPVESSSVDTDNMLPDEELSDEEGLQIKESAEDLIVPVESSSVDTGNLFSDEELEDLVLPVESSPVDTDNLFSDEELEDLALPVESSPFDASNLLPDEERSNEESLQVIESAEDRALPINSFPVNNGYMLTDEGHSDKVSLQIEESAETLSSPVKLSKVDAGDILVDGEMSDEEDLQIKETPENPSASEVLAAPVRVEQTNTQSWTKMALAAAVCLALVAVLIHFSKGVNDFAYRIKDAGRQVLVHVAGSGKLLQEKKVDLLSDSVSKVVSEHIPDTVNKPGNAIGSKKFANVVNISPRAVKKKKASVYREKKSDKLTAEKMVEQSVVAKRDLVAKEKAVASSIPQSQPVESQIPVEHLVPEIIAESPAEEVSLESAKVKKITTTKESIKTKIYHHEQKVQDSHITPEIEVVEGVLAVSESDVVAIIEDEINQAYQGKAKVKKEVKDESQHENEPVDSGMVIEWLLSQKKTQ